MSRDPLYESVYDLLDALRVRPGMFLGGKSIALLQAFLSGLRFANLRAGTPSFWEFSAWFTVWAKPQSISFPWHHIEQTEGPERAVDIYFDYLDEFRRNSPSELAHIGPPFEPNFVFVVDGRRAAPEIAERLALVRLAPSNVIFLHEHYTGRDEPDAQAFATLEEARAAACVKWGAAIDRWKPTEDDPCRAG